MKSNEEIRDLQRQVENLSRENTAKQLRINKCVRALDRVIVCSTDQWTIAVLKQIQAELRGGK